MTRPAEDTNPRGGENQSVVTPPLAGGSITIPTGDTLLALLSYLTVLHLIYLVWEEASESELG